MTSRYAHTTGDDQIRAISMSITWTGPHFRKLGTSETHSIMLRAAATCLENATAFPPIRLWLHTLGQPLHSPTSSYPCPPLVTILLATFRW